MEMKILQNGLKTSSNRKRKRKSTKRRKRNPAVAVAAKPVARKRNGVSVSRAKAVLKKNGLKAVSTKAVGNRKKSKRRRRNGLTVTRTARNGFFGNTKSDAMQVAALGGGALLTQFVGNLINQFAAPYAASFGIGQYSGLISKGITAVLITPYAVGMVSKKGDSVKMARLGGLLVVGLDLVAQFFPQVNLNPFNNSPVLINSNGAALLTPQGATSLAAAAGADPNTVAKMAGAIQAVTGGSDYPTYQNPAVMSAMGSGDDWE